MNSTWNLSGWSLAYFGVLLLVVLDVFDVVNIPWYVWWPTMAVAVWGVLTSWGRREDEHRDGRSA